MTDITQEELIELTHHYIIDWYAVLLQQERLYDDTEKLSPDLRKRITDEIQDTLKGAIDSPLAHFLSAEYGRELKYIFSMLNEPHATSTKLNSYHMALGLGHISDNSQFYLAVIYVIAAAIHVSAQPDQYSHDGIKLGLLKFVMPDEDVVKHAKRLVDAVSKQGLDIGDLLPRIVDLANGGQHKETLEPAGKASERVIREITLISKSIFEITNNRGQGRFSTSVIERILELLCALGCLDKAIKYKQISNLQLKFDNDCSKPLTYNQHDLPF